MIGTRAGHMRCRLILLISSLGCILHPSVGSGSPPFQRTERTEDLARLVKKIHCDGVLSFWTISPNGKFLAYGDTTYEETKAVTTFVLVDLATGRELRRCKGAFAAMGVFSCDAKHLAVSDSPLNGEAAVWDVEHWKP